MSPRESTQRREVELWARNVGEFCLNSDLHVTFRDLLHAVKLRHRTDGFTSPPKEGLLKVFFRPKNPTASAGCEPANLGTKGQHATSRPPKQLILKLYKDFKRSVLRQHTPLEIFETLLQNVYAMNLLS